MQDLLLRETIELAERREVDERAGGQNLRRQGIQADEVRVCVAEVDRDAVTARRTKVRDLQPAALCVELGLTFGNTWHVIGIVIAGILFMAFLANCVVQWLQPKSPWIPFILLLASLALGYLVSKYGSLPPTPLGKLAVVAILTSPMFFSGLVFSALIQSTKNIAAIMAINILGAMVGGLLEYNSMYFGFQFLYLLAGLMYLLAMITYYFRLRTSPA